MTPLARPPRPSALPAHGVGAHRGASRTHPENTAAAIRAAVEAGAQQIEIDVRLTSDGALVLMHDDRVDRTTDGEGEVAELSLAQIRALDAGAKQDAAFRGERVPTLEEVLVIVPPDRWLNLDLKGGAALGLAALRRVDEAHALDHVVFAAKPEAAQAIRRARPSAWICDTERQLSRGRYIERAAARGADFVQLRSDQGHPTASEVARAKELGLRVNFCCAAGPEEAEALWRLGVDFPLMSDPAAALERGR